jgi:hypothetical protein
MTTLIAALRGLFASADPVIADAVAKDAAAIGRLHAASFRRGWSDDEIERLLLDRSVIAHRVTIGRAFAGFVMSRRRSRNPVDRGGRRAQRTRSCRTTVAPPSRAPRRRAGARGISGGRRGQRARDQALPPRRVPRGRPAPRLLSGGRRQAFQCIDPAARSRLKGVTGDCFPAAIAVIELPAFRRILT